MADKKPFFTNINTAPTRDMKLGRGTGIKLINPEIGSQKLDVHINVINDDSGPGEVHFHRYADNVYIVLEGVLEVVVEGERWLLKKDDVGFIPRENLVGRAEIKFFSVDGSAWKFWQ